MHNVLEITTKKIEGIEIEQYLNVEYPNFGKSVVSVKGQYQNKTIIHLQHLVKTPTFIIYKQILYHKY